MLGQSNVYMVPGVHATSGLTEKGRDLEKVVASQETTSKWLGSHGLRSRAIDKLCPEVHIKSPPFKDAL